jgi:hypothetical protein
LATEYNNFASAFVSVSIFAARALHFSMIHALEPGDAEK